MTEKEQLERDTERLKEQAELRQMMGNKAGYLESRKALLLAQARLVEMVRQIS